jgi:acetyltransferase-like isoleucine patch superfamily enzyme
LCLVAVVLPQAAKRRLYRALGWEIDATARIGLSYLHAEQVTLGPGTRIGHFNVVRHLRSFALRRDSYILNFNKFFGDPAHPDWARSFALGEESRIMSAHFFDVAGAITIGDRCTVGGRDSQFWSHSRFTGHGLDQRELSVEEGVYIGARATIVHCRIPAFCVVGAGAVVTRSFDEQHMVIAGNPAEQVQNVYAAAARRARAGG